MAKRFNIIGACIPARHYMADMSQKLEKITDLYEFVFKIIMNGMDFTYNPRNAVIHSGNIYGILKKEKGKVRVHNRLYEQLIYDYMSSNLETSLPGFTIKRMANPG